ncbi:MAG: NAD+ diphosphatase [Paraglaciecola sp.]|jgi:NAD+ diphosphatase
MFTYCPECKKSNISFIDNHYFSCPDCGFLYYHNVAASVAAIIEYQDEILLTVRAKEPSMGLLDLPGGFVDPNESLEEALSREISEELSLTITPSQFKYFSSQPNTYYYKKIKYNTLDTIFSIKLNIKPKILCEVLEIQSAIWVKRNQINVDEMAFASTKKALLKYIS